MADRRNPPPLPPPFPWLPPRVLKHSWAEYGDLGFGKHAGPVVHREWFGGGRFAVGLLLALLLGPLVIGPLVDPDLAGGVRDGSLPIAVGLMSPLFACFVLGIALYSGITLRTDRLRVGREVIPLAWLDPARVDDLLGRPPARFLVRYRDSTRSWNAPGPTGGGPIGLALESALGRTQAPRRPLPRRRQGPLAGGSERGNEGPRGAYAAALERGQGRLLGGAYRLPLGSDAVVLRDWWGRELRVSVGRRRAFLEALARALATPLPWPSIDGFVPSPPPGSPYAPPPPPPPAQDQIARLRPNRSV